MAWFQDVQPNEVFFLDDPFFNPPLFSDPFDFTSIHNLRRRRHSRNPEMRQTISVLIEEIPFHEFALHEHLKAITHTFIRYDDELHQEEEDEEEEEEGSEMAASEGAFVYDFATKKWIPEKKESNNKHQGTQQDPIEIDMEEEENTNQMIIMELEDLAFRNLLHLPRTELYSVFEL